MHIAKCAMWYIVLVTAYTNFLLDATGPTARLTIADITEFHIVFHLWSLIISGNRDMLN